MFDRAVIFLNNRLGALRGQKRLPAESILLLLPRCLQLNDCGRNVVDDVSNCVRCGRCPMAELIALAEEFGVRIAMATGGRRATELVGDEAVRAVVAVACEKELAEGILATRRLKTKVYAIRNTQPEGFCRNTQVEVDQVRSVLERLVNNEHPQH